MGKEQEKISLLEQLEAGEEPLSFELGTLRSLLTYWKIAEELLLDGKVSVQKVLNGNTAELQEMAENEIKAVYKSILSHLEVGLAEHQELFRKMRPLILRAGNDAIRNVAQILKDFHTLRIAESQTVVHRPEGYEHVYGVDEIPRLKIVQEGQ